MARPKKTEQNGEQLDLIDVTPEELKNILPIVKAYRRVVKDRVELTNKETELKKKSLAAIKDAGLKRQEDGTIKVTIDGITIIVAPQDDKITIKEVNKKDKNEPDVE